MDTLVKGILYPVQADFPSILIFLHGDNIKPTRLPEQALVLVQIIMGGLADLVLFSGRDALCSAGESRIGSKAYLDEYDASRAVLCDQVDFAEAAIEIASQNLVLVLAQKANSMIFGLVSDSTLANRSK